MNPNRHRARALTLTALVALGGACFRGSEGGGDASAGTGVAGAANGTWDITFVLDGVRRNASVDLSGSGARYRFVATEARTCFDQDSGATSERDLLVTYATSFWLSADASRIDVTTERTVDASLAEACGISPDPARSTYVITRDSTLPSSFGQLGGTWRVEGSRRPCTFELRGGRVSGACDEIHELSPSSFTFSLALAADTLTGTLGAGEVAARRRP